MAYNLLSGTVVANESVVFQPSSNGGPHTNAIVGEFHGNGQYLENVARVVANGTTDYMLTGAYVLTGSNPAISLYSNGANWFVF